jgi:hypothetical protein
MDCLTCRDLERAFESSHRAYIEARSAAYYRVSMERAKSDLEEHQLCVSHCSGETA